LFSYIGQNNIFNRSQLSPSTHPYQKRISNAYPIDQGLSFVTLSSLGSSKAYVVMLLNPLQTIVNASTSFKQYFSFFSRKLNTSNTFILMLAWISCSSKHAKSKPYKETS
jgi:hypothetical protein